MSTFATRSAFNESYPFTSRVEAETHADGRTVVACCAFLTVRYGFVKPRSAVTVETNVAPVRSERHVYTPSGKKSTSRIQAGKAFKMFPNNRKAMIAQAVAFGVKPATANAMFSHYKVGRYTA